MWLEGLLLLIAICYGCHLWAFSYWKRRGIFQLDGSFIFGNIKDVLFMKKSMNSFILDIYMKHKQHKIIGIYSFYTPMLMVTDPEVMRQVMVKDFNSFAGPPMDVYENVDPMFGINPFCTHGIETWKERRGLHASLLSPSKLKAMPDLIINVGRNMINYINKNNGEIKVKELADLYAIDSVCCFSYGCEPSSFTDPENSFRKHAGDTLFDSDSAQAINGGFLYPFITNLFRYRVVTKVCQDFFVAMCRKMMEFRMKNPSNRPDFFEHMAKANTKLILDGKKGFTDLEIAGHCMTIYFDSFFTTSSGFSYLLIELSKNPDLQEKLRSEILNCGKNMEDFDYEKINSLPLLHMAMNGVIRMWLEISLLLIAICYGLHRWAFSYWKRRGVFQLDGSFIFGNIKDIFFMKKDLQTFAMEIYQKHKEHKIIGIYSFYTPYLMVTDPEVMKQVMIKDFNSFAGPAMDVDMKIDPMFGINPFSTHGIEKWKEIRGLHVSMLTQSKLKALPDLVINVGRSMINFIKEKNGDIKVKELSDLFAIDSVCCFTYAYEPSAFTNPETPFIKYACDSLFDSTFAQAINSYFLYPFLAKLLKYRTVTKEFEDFFLRMSKKMMEFRAKNPANRPNFFEHMAKANTKLINEGKKGFTDLEIAGHCVTAYLDSFFTTSSGLCFLIIELSNNLEFQEKLRLEILNQGEKMEDFDFEKINSLPLLQMAMIESLRLHSPVPVSFRTCTRTTEINGAKVEKGTKIALPFFALHMDSQYYTEPEKFNPERYSTDESLMKGTLLPFGDGPRMCLGSKYASLVIKTAVLYLLLNFKILPDDTVEEKKSNILPFNGADENKKVIFMPLHKS